MFTFTSFPSRSLAVFSNTIIPNRDLRTCSLPIYSIYVFLYDFISMEVYIFTYVRHSNGIIQITFAEKNNEKKKYFFIYNIEMIKLYFSFHLDYFTMPMEERFFLSFMWLCNNSNWIDKFWIMFTLEIQDKITIKIDMIC
jgi:hypothetical protein